MPNSWHCCLLTPNPLQPCCRRQAKVLAEMEARGIEPVPSGPDTLGLQASAAAAAQLPSVPLVPEQAPPEDLGVGKDEEEGVPAGSRAGAGTSATAGPSTAAAESEGAEGPSAEEVEAAMVSQLASAEARERGNECFRRRKWEQVRCVVVWLCGRQSGKGVFHCR